RGRDNIAKRVLLHAAAFNVALLMRLKYGLRKPRSHGATIGARLLHLVEWLGSIFGVVRRSVAILSAYQSVVQRKPALSAA
ncbi:MAG: hypothetical protein WBD40_08315, partial [Tepidisphaeraceae bacterium]